MAWQKLSVTCASSYTTHVDGGNIQGSGKTLAYGLPILHHILAQPRPATQKRKLQALILAPTRELALQVSDHLNAFSRIVDTTVKEEHGEVNLSNVKSKGRAPASSTQDAQGLPLVSIAVLVGGMSAQKQRRLLDRGIDVLIATPGRLWDIIEEVCPCSQCPQHC